MKSSNHTSDSLFQELSNFENAILTARANTLVTFTTIPPASFAKFQTSKKLHVPIIPEADIQKFQHNHDSIIDEVNKKIISHISIPQGEIIVLAQYST